MNNSNTKETSIKFRKVASIEQQQGKALKIILSIIAILLIIIILIFYFTSNLSRNAHMQLDDIKQGNLEAAYNMTSSDFQKEIPLDTFKTLISDYPILKDYKKVKFTERKIENGLGYVAGTIEAPDGSIMKIEYQFIKEDGQWKIQAFRLTKPE